jgi:hypothetical protein
MWINACYHRIRIRVKLTCDERCGSVGAGDERVATAGRLLPSGKPLARINERIPAHIGRLT